MLDFEIVIGSTREGRSADVVVPCVVDRAQRHGAFQVDLLDLRDWPLPMFSETIQTIGDLADPTYSQPIVRQWNHKTEEGDALLFVTPEYNRTSARPRRPPPKPRPEPDLTPTRQNRFWGKDGRSGQLPHLVR